MLNRESLFATLETLEKSGRPAGALAIVRMQRLREYEALFGYEAGDGLKQALDLRLGDCLRESDTRILIGEGAFAVVMAGLRDRSHLQLAASGMARAFRQPLQWQGLAARVDVAVGACMLADATSVDMLCRHADRACTKAAQLRERYALFDGDMLESLSHGELEAVLAANRLQVYLQPVVSLTDGAVLGFESLSRWPESGYPPVSPSVFVPVAEQTGLIDALTRWNINASLRHFSPWLHDHPDLHCSINVSPVALIAPGFAEQLAASLSIWQVPARNLRVEITETAFVDNQELIATALQTLHASGVGISIDDFGTGYSSLSYLKRFPVDELKIDMSFIRDISHDPRCAQLVASVVDMAHRLGATTVAEGIEDASTLAALQAMGCDHGQGYHLGRPQPADKALAAGLRQD